MPTWLKVLLIVGGLLVVLFVAAAFGLVYVAKRYGPALVEAGKQSVEEGRAHGRLTDNEGCVGEAASRHRRDQGISAALNNNLFLNGCLSASQPTPGFCDDVPSPFEFVKTARWQTDECKRYGLAPESQCGQLFQPVQQFCQRRRTSSQTGASPEGVGPEEEDDDAEDSGGDEEEPPPPPAPPAAPSPRAR
jgi:hypothetical protein